MPKSHSKITQTKNRTLVLNKKNSQKRLKRMLDPYFDTQKKYRPYEFSTKKEIRGETFCNNFCWC